MFYSQLSGSLFIYLSLYSIMKLLLYLLYMSHKFLGIHWQECHIFSGVKEYVFCSKRENKNIYKASLLFFFFPFPLCLGQIFDWQGFSCGGARIEDLSIVGLRLKIWPGQLAWLEYLGLTKSGVSASRVQDFPGTSLCSALLKPRRKLLGQHV